MIVISCIIFAELSPSGEKWLPLLAVAVVVVSEDSKPAVVALVILVVIVMAVLAAVAVIVAVIVAMIVDLVTAVGFESCEDETNTPAYKATDPVVVNKLYSNIGLVTTKGRTAGAGQQE